MDQRPRSQRHPDVHDRRADAGTHQATRQQWKDSCGFVVLDAFTSLGGDHGPSDTLFNATYVVPFLALDNTGDVDPQLAGCGAGAGVGGSPGTGGDGAGTGGASAGTGGSGSGSSGCACAVASDDGSGRSYEALAAALALGCLAMARRRRKEFRSPLPSAGEC